LVTLNSIAWLSSRAVPVADIRFPFIPKPVTTRHRDLEMVFRCCVLYSVFAPGERLYERGQHVEISGNRKRSKMTSGHFQANGGRTMHSHKINKRKKEKGALERPLLLVVVMSAVELWKER